MSKNGKEPVKEFRSVQTSRGKTVQVRSVSPHFLADLHGLNTLPEAPYREIPTDLPGHSDKEFLKADDLRDDAEKEIWEVYQKARLEALASSNEKFLEAIYFRGVQVDDSDLDSWAEEREYFGLEIPENRIRRKIKFIQDEVVGSTDDILNIVIAALEETGIPEEDRARVEAMFRGSVRRSSAKSFESAIQQVDLEREIPGDEGSPLLGDLASEQVLGGVR